MKRLFPISFSKKLALQILSVCAIIFILLFAILYFQPRVAQQRNATAAAKLITERAMTTIIEQGHHVERLASLLATPKLQALFLHEDTSLFRQLLSASPLLCGCAIEYTPGYKSHDLFSYKVDSSIRHERIPRGSNAFAPERLNSHAQNARKPHWVNYYYSPNYLRQQVFSRFLPLHDPQGGFAGYLRLDIPLEGFTRFIKELHFYETGFTCILDRQGIFVAHPDNTVLTRSTLNPMATSKYMNFYPLVQECSRADRGTSRLSADGKSYFVYFERVPQSGWYVLAICPLQEIYAPVSQVVHRSLLGSLLCVVILFLLIPRVIRKSFRPLKQFAGITRTIADGNLNVHLPDIHNNEEIKELRDSFQYMQRKIVDAFAYQRQITADKEKIESEIRVAQSIQERFLPAKHALNHVRFSLYAILEQSKVVGGDLYYYIHHNDKLYFAIGDVRGKGIPAALYMASVATLFNYMARTKTSAAEICNTLNDYLCENLDDDMFITMFVGILDLSSGLLNYTNAGHPYPILKRADGQTLFLKEALMMPLGIMKLDYPSCDYTMLPRDLLVAYTDGISEAQNERQELYTKERLFEFIRTLPLFLSPDEVTDNVLTDLINYIGDTNDADDTTLFTLQWKHTP